MTFQEWYKTKVGYSLYDFDNIGEFRWFTRAIEDAWEAGYKAKCDETPVLEEKYQIAH